MARFQYVAKDMKGKIKKGTVEAASEKTLTADLLGGRPISGGGEEPDGSPGS